MRGISLEYLLKRIGLFLLTVWVGTTAIFIIPRLSPGDPVETILGRLAMSGANVENSEQLVADMKEKFGLDQPLHIQYFRYLSNTFTFQSGYSLSNFPSRVDDMIARSMPWTIGLLSTAMIITFILGNGIGALLAWKGTPRPVKAILSSSLLFTAIPAFIIGIILIYIFSYKLGMLPYSGAYDRTVDQGWNIPFMINVVKHAILPALSVILVEMGSWALSMRGLMITTEGEDYMVLAKAKGLRPGRILLKYGIRNALLPQVTRLGVRLGSIASGFLIVELIFSYPGIGSLLYKAILNNDYTLIQGIVFYLILGVSLAVLLLDLMYPLIDPRIKYE